MLGSFQVLDGEHSRRRPDGGSLYWRGVFPRAEAGIVAGSWDVAGLRGTGSFDWRVENVFLPERRTMPHAASRWITSGSAGRGLPTPCRSGSGWVPTTAPSSPASRGSASRH